MVVKTMIACVFGAIAAITTVRAECPKENAEASPVPGHAASNLPAGKKFKLMWHDEFDGDSLDTSKWCYRTNFWGRPAPWYAGPEDNAVCIKDGFAHLKIIEKDGQLKSPQLQTGGLLWDIPQERHGIWLFPPREPAKFLKKYGYFECRCRLQKHPGWWSAFWMQAPANGATTDPAISGIEHDIMESFIPGKVIPAWFHYNGYGAEYSNFSSSRRPAEDNEVCSDDVGTDEFHTYGMLWEPDGYTLYLDGRQRGFKVGTGPGEAISHVPEFILLTTEVKGCRDNAGGPDSTYGSGKAPQASHEAVKAGDEFVVDYVRVYDVVDSARPIPRPAPRPALAARLANGPEIIGIVHWGLNTYTDREWGYGDEDPAMLNPAKFDADQIVGACKAGGIGGLVVVAKHHDGFCLWPTKTTEHNITKTPFWKCKVESVKCKTSGDYVKEMEQACRRAGLKFGVYCSPWDRNNAHYGTEKYVTDVFQQQLRELLSGNYGEIFEMWFDGANGGDGYYGGAREKRQIPNGYYRYDTETFAMVRKLQPKVAIFSGAEDDSDLRWPGNEQGLLDPDSRATVCTVGGFVNRKYGNPEYYVQNNTGSSDGDFFRVCEADFPLRKGWFYHESECGTTRSAAYLTKLYLSSVGNAGVMNIGIAPNKDGLLDAGDVKALAGFKTLKDALFAHEVKQGESFNVVVMREDISKGEQVDEWEFAADGKAILRGKSIGLKRIRVLETPCAAKSCKVNVLKDGGALQGVSFRLYRADPELVRLVLSSTTESGETDTAKWMTATSDIWQ